MLQGPLSGRATIVWVRHGERQDAVDAAAAAEAAQRKIVVSVDTTSAMSNASTDSDASNTAPTDTTALTTPPPSMPPVEYPPGDPPLTVDGRGAVSPATRHLVTDLAAAGIGLPAAATFVISSPFRRCVETAEELAGELHRMRPAAPAPALSIDDSIGEVFGPQRIKCDEPPRLGYATTLSPVPSVIGSGQQAMWGEDVPSAHARFLDAFRRHQLHVAQAADAAPGGNAVVFLVTHGDAMQAVMGHVCPGRIVFDCTYLSFAAVTATAQPHRSLSSGAVPWTVACTGGLQWLDDDSVAVLPAATSITVPRIAATSAPPVMRTTRYGSAAGRAYASSDSTPPSETGLVNDAPPPPPPSIQERIVGKIFALIPWAAYTITFTSGRQFVAASLVVAWGFVVHCLFDRLARVFGDPTVFPSPEEVPEDDGPGTPFLGLCPPNTPRRLTPGMAFKGAAITGIRAFSALIATYVSLEGLAWSGFIASPDKAMNNSTPWTFLTWVVACAAYCVLNWLRLPLRVYCNLRHIHV